MKSAYHSTSTLTLVPQTRTSKTGVSMELNTSRRWGRRRFDASTLRHPRGEEEEGTRPLVAHRMGDQHRPGITSHWLNRLLYFFYLHPPHIVCFYVLGMKKSKKYSTRWQSLIWKLWSQVSFLRIEIVLVLGKAIGFIYHIYYAAYAPSGSWTTDFNQAHSCFGDAPGDYSPKWDSWRLGIHFCRSVRFCHQMNIWGKFQFRPLAKL